MRGVTSGPSTTTADLILQTLSNAGVSLVFGLPGVHNLGFWRSLDEHDTHASGIRVIAPGEVPGVRFLRGRGAALACMNGTQD